MALLSWSPKLLCMSDWHVVLNRNEQSLKLDWGNTGEQWEHTLGGREDKLGLDGCRDCLLEALGQGVLEQFNHGRSCFFSKIAMWERVVQDYNCQEALTKMTPARCR